MISYTHSENMNFMSIQENLENIRRKLPEQVRLVVVSKTQAAEDIREAYDYGQRLFGENKAQELIAKQPLLPEDIQWHFIGHLQTNKVKFIVPFVSLIESVDSMKLLGEINRQAQKCNRIIDCLLQFHIAREETKFGLAFEEATEILGSAEYKSCKNISITGVMGMASFTEDKSKVRQEFRDLKQICTDLKEAYFTRNEFFSEISMGMSGDYEIAIEEGSTIVRIGTAVFGERGKTMINDQ
jgi:pyridoxal phosphate enzyme (YggS family)